MLSDPTSPPHLQPGMSPLCVEIGNPDWWFPERGDPTQTAKAVCRRCTMMSECLEYAVRVNVDGIWGATTQRERSGIRRVTGIESHTLWAEPLPYRANAT